MTYEAEKKVRMGDIAEELGVSIVTVSNALKGKSGVGESLRSEILEKAEEMGYQVKKMSHPDAEQAKKSHRMGVIIAERYVKEYASFYMVIYKHVVQAAMKQGCLTALAIVETEAEKQNRTPPMFGSMEIEGLLIIDFLYSRNGCGTKGHIRIPEADEMSDELSAFIRSLGDDIWLIEP